MRMGLIPFFIGAFYLPHPWGAWGPFALFTVAGVTDWFDGYLARRWHAASKLGACFDPIADKLLIISALFMLVKVDSVVLLPALLIAVREILVSGLREHLSRAGSPALKVTFLAKCKTAVQMVAILAVMAGPGLGGAWHAYAVVCGPVLLWLAALLTLVTGGDYLLKALKYL